MKTEGSSSSFFSLYSSFFSSFRLYNSVNLVYTNQHTHTTCNIGVIIEIFLVFILPANRSICVSVWCFRLHSTHTLWVPKNRIELSFIWITSKHLLLKRWRQSDCTAAQPDKWKKNEMKNKCCVFSSVWGDVSKISNSLVCEMGIRRIVCSWVCVWPRDLLLYLPLMCNVLNLSERMY